MEKINKSIGRSAYSAGLYLGEEKSNRFRPSVALLDLLSKASHRWVSVDDKAEWLFMCGRDVFASSVLKANVTSGTVLVANSRGEILGYGKIRGTLDKKNSIFIENMLDRGDFLRREMHKHKGLCPESLFDG